MPHSRTGKGDEHLGSVEPAARRRWPILSYRAAPRHWCRRVDVSACAVCMSGNHWASHVPRRNSQERASDRSCCARPAVHSAQNSVRPGKFPGGEVQAARLDRDVTIDDGRLAHPKCPRTYSNVSWLPGCSEKAPRDSLDACWPSSPAGDRLGDFRHLIGGIPQAPCSLGPTIQQKSQSIGLSTL